MSRRVVREQAAAELGISEQDADAVYREISRELDAEFRESVKELKAEQLERLQDDLMRLRQAARDDPGNPRKWSALSRHEAIFARVAGTFEPIGIKIEADVRIRESLLAVIASMGQEDMDQAVARALARRRQDVETKGSAA